MSLRIRSTRDCWRGAASAFGDELASAPPKNRCHGVRVPQVLRDSSLVSDLGRTAPQRAPTPPGTGTTTQRCADVCPRSTPFVLKCGPTLARFLLSVALSESGF